MDVCRQQKLACRVHLLAQLFGAGGLLHPAEVAARDIVPLALLDEADALIVCEGAGWVKLFKVAVRRIALSHIAKIGSPTHDFISPELLLQEHQQWHNNMYEQLTIVCDEHDIDLDRGRA